MSETAESLVGRAVAVLNSADGSAFTGEIVAEAPNQVAVHWAEPDGTCRTAWFNQHTRRCHDDAALRFEKEEAP